MNFYTKQHTFYCGIDLHAKKMYVCILDQQNKVQVHKNIKTDPNDFLKLIEPYAGDMIIGVECVFCWYWLSDLCAEHQLAFVLEVKEEIIVDIPRPRSRETIIEDERYYQIRNKIIRFLSQRKEEKKQPADLKLVA